MLNPLLEYSRKFAPPDDHLVRAGEQLNSRTTMDAGVSVLTAAAEDLNPFALCRLSTYYSDDREAWFSPSLAFSLAKRAADLNFAPGHFLVGWYHEHGVGVEKNDAVARAQYEIAAERAYGVAAIHLALMLSSGECDSTSFLRAIELVSLAANHGDSVSAMQLGEWYESGTGVGKDEGKALKWYKTAAELGSTLASLRLSMAYASGDLGLKRDSRRSEEYLAKATRGDLG